MATACWLWQVLLQAVGAADARLPVRMQHVSHNVALRCHNPHPAVCRLKDLHMLMITGPTWACRMLSSVTIAYLAHRYIAVACHHPAPAKDKT